MWNLEEQSDFLKGFGIEPYFPKIIAMCKAWAPKDGLTIEKQPLRDIVHKALQVCIICSPRRQSLVRSGIRLYV